MLGWLYLGGFEALGKLKVPTVLYVSCQRVQATSPLFAKVVLFWPEDAISP